VKLHSFIIPAIFFAAIEFFLPPVSVHADDQSKLPDTTKQKAEVTAVRATEPITIDGNLSEQEWQRPGIMQFTQRDPIEGISPTQRTEVWVAYDDAAMYIAARMYDTHPDSIVSRIGRRDASLTSDWFYVGIDSYHDKLTGFYFGVYAGGTMTDGTLYNDSWDDNTWDGVWDAATKIDDKGWTVEMRIPFSQLRFTKQDQYVWGINFIRTIARNNERDDFVLVPKKESGWVSRFADLTGLHDINPPLKLEILPYEVSTGKFLLRQPGDPYNSGHDLAENFGGDLKAGLGSNLTLNATINPDFGQVEVDPAVINLTQFETYFDEKRPFFVEGSNFFNFGSGGANSNWGFNWGSPTFFYSRRIGRPPQGSVQHTTDDGLNDMFYDIPDHTPIIGAAKLTGKISDSWSIGAVQAVTAREYGKTDSAGVQFSDVVEPLSYYGVVRGLHDFDQGRHAIGFFGTLVDRDLNHDYLQSNFNRQASMVGMDGWATLDSTAMWVVTGWFAGSNLQGSSGDMLNIQESSLHYYQRPDIDYVHLDSNATSLSGYAGRVAINKQKGNSYLNAAIGIISPGFDINDAGFMFRTNEINSHIVLGYQWFQPDGLFRSKSFDIATFRNFDFGGRKTGEGNFLFYNGQFMNYWFLSGSMSYYPGTVDNLNTRGGPAMMSTNQYFESLYMNTDSRSALVYSFGTNLERSESGGYHVEFDPGIEWHPTAGLSITISPDITRDVTIAQWVDNIPDPTAKATYGTRYVFGKLDYRSVSSDIRIDWTFTPKLTLQIYMQPLIGVGTYSEFKELKQPGTYTFNNYGENGSAISYNDNTGEYLFSPAGAPSFTIANPDFNSKSLKVNAILRWEYSPGSTLYFVWTQLRNNYDDPGNFNFNRDFGNLFSRQGGDNVFLVKASYWWNP